MQCNAMQCNAMQCNTMQCNAMQCNAIQYNTVSISSFWTKIKENAETLHTIVHVPNGTIGKMAFWFDHINIAIQTKMQIKIANDFLCL